MWHGRQLDSFESYPRRMAGAEQIIMRNIEVVGHAIALAIQGSNGMRITAEQHKEMLRGLAKDSSPDEMVDNVSSVANLSALNQELERAGLVKCERTLSALMSVVKKNL